MDLKPECCGNNVTEALEDGKKGNSCTCPEDYGACNPTITIERELGQYYEAKYIRRECDKNLNCVAVNINELQRSNEFFNTFLESGFTLNIYVRYKTPFDKGNSKFDVEFKLSDADPNLVQLPVKINEIRIMDNANVLVRTSPNMEFDEVMDIETYTLVINDYSIVNAEEIKTVTLSIDYEYTPMVDETDPITGITVKVPGTIVRRKYDISIEAIPFLDKTLVPY
jgi:hypothetical protein